jgi:hypothetical protein
MLAWGMNMGFAASAGATATPAIIPFRRLGLGFSVILLCMVLL